jgi:transposase
MLAPELQAEILSLHFGKKLGTKKISKLLRVNRKTVKAIIAARAVSLHGDSRMRGSLIDPYKDEVIEFLIKTPEITAKTIFTRIREKGFDGGYTVVRKWVRGRRVDVKRPREAFLSLEFAPGECAQVDWGEFGDVFNDGIKIHCFLMVLCHSRLLYIEFTRSEKFEEFIRCHENAFKFFGNLVPQECWYDNLRSAVVDRMGRLIRFNSRFMAYMGHHGIKPHACNPARGNEKGRVEDGVKYVRSSFWAGRKFLNFEDLCEQSRAWLNETANKREHRSTRKVPILYFEAEEKKQLRPMNPYLYDTEEVFSRVVPPNFYILYDTNKYSVPWTLVGMNVTIRISDQRIKIFYNEKFVTTHDRTYKKHQIVTNQAHLKGLLERKPGATRSDWQLSAIKSMGEDIRRYVDLLRSGSRSLRYEVSKLLALVTVYGEENVNEAVGELLKLGVVGSENLELTLKSKNHENLAPKPLNFSNAKLNRVVPTVDLRRFDALLVESANLIIIASEKTGEDHGPESITTPKDPNDPTT